MRSWPPGQLAARPPLIDAARLAEVVEGLGLSWDEAFADVPDRVDDLARAARPAPFAAAAIASHVVARHPDAELLAWWCADLVVAQSLGWPRPLPLLMAQAFAPAFRAEGGHGKRLRPGEAGFERAVCLGLAQGAADACRLAGEIQRRAARLAVVAPKLRAKGAAAMIQKLSDDDAVPGALTTKTLSRFQMLSKTGPVFMDRLTCPGPKHRHSKV